MEPARWQKINQLFNSALEKEASERPGYLDRASAGDECLRLEVEALLAEHEQARGFMSSPAVEAAARVIATDEVKSPIGTQISHYRIISWLGAGGMAEVYLALDTRLSNRRVALKLLPEKFTEDPERVRRFKQEARAASCLNHPNIITIFEIDDVGGSYFIVTEFIDGLTLRRQMADARMKLRNALESAIQVASALTAAHEAGIVHRDIKPENIMVLPEGLIKVLDFGLAKLLEQNVPGNSDTSTVSWLNTDPGKVMGTTRYMSPEQIRGQKVDGRSDIFSLGVVLYEMLAGQRPFDQPTPGEVFAAILNQEAPPLAHYAREIPTELERIVSKALAKDREDRYQVVKDLCIDLKTLKSELEFDARLKHFERWSSHRGAEGEDRHKEVAGSNPQAPLPGKLKVVNDAVKLDPGFYVVRPTDLELRSAIVRQDGIVLVKGSRHSGKTFLLARGLQKAQESGASVVLTDFRNLGSTYLESIDKLLLRLAESIAEQLTLNVFPNQVWNSHRTASANFEHYMRHQVFAKVSSPIIWGLDEVDRLFTSSCGSEVFRLFHSWNHMRDIIPAGPWQRLTLVMTYASEPHLFITDLNQSPFNVATPLLLDDFTLEQVEELNHLHGSPLRNKAELEQYYRLVGGHPYLARCGLSEMVVQHLDLAALEGQAADDEGPFGEHLRRILVYLDQNSGLLETVRLVLKGQDCTDPESFYRLRSEGLVSGPSPSLVQPRCQLYATYLEKHLTRRQSEHKI